MPWWLTAALALVVLGCLGAVAALGTMFAVYTSYARDYVPIEEKLRQRYAGLTEIYDRGGPRDGELLGILPNSTAQLLDPVPLSAISQHMIDATVSTEDNSFWTNPGVNPRGLLRAAYENYFGGEFGEGTGGSSITQQLIKNVYLSDQCQVKDGVQSCVAPRTVDRKLREIAFAIELEKDYNKEQILEWYLNQISYADRYVGVEAASQGYFRKPASQLTLAEAALLAGVPAAPTTYHPRENCIRDAEAEGQPCIHDELGRTTVGGDAKRRQEDVLDLMVSHKWITRAEAEAAKAEPLLVYPVASPLKAAAWIDNQVQPRLVRMCQAGMLTRLPGSQDCFDSVHSAGYRVTTTLDWGLTQEATAIMQQYIAAGLEAGCQCHNAAVVTIDPVSGQIIVYAPNVDPTNKTDPFVSGDIDQLTEINQPGSSFKPAVYLAWFDVLNKTPMSILWDTSPLTVEGTAIVNPRGGGGTEGLISARAGLGGSQNVPAFRAAQEAGVDNVIAVAKKLGITTLDQHFDPTFRAHPDVTYGASIATGGANLRAVDMAYMNAVIANMGVMVGVPTLARTVELKDLKSFALDTGENYDKARDQALEFARGHIRIPGTRELDPVVILKIEDAAGNVLFEQGEPERKQVMDAGSVWLLHSIMSDCTARFIIWGCSGSNADNALDWFLPDGAGGPFPAGVKTGTQQGPLRASDTLATWTNGYTRYAATAVWVGNANKALVYDGQFASAHATLRIYKTWMSVYHGVLRDRGAFETPAGFDDLQPANVARRAFKTPATDRTLGADKGKCEQTVTTWVRTDVKYEDQCEELEIDIRNGLLASDQTPAVFRVKRQYVKLPALKPDLAEDLAKRMGIPIAPKEKSTGRSAVAIASPTNGKNISEATPVVGDVQTANLKDWKLEIGEGSNPRAWNEIGRGTNAVTNGVLGTIPATLGPGVYTIRLTATDSVLGDVATTVTVNFTAKTPEPTRTPIPGGGGGGGGATPTPTRTPTPN
jgi:membrane peptidoglycan carboxypeptidase